jgi:hypothetical protein
LLGAVLLMEGNGPLIKRMAIAAGGAMIPPLIWLGFDFLMTGDPLISLRATRVLEESGRALGIQPVDGFGGLLEEFYATMFAKHLLLSIVALIGLVLYARSGKGDRFGREWVLSRLPLIYLLCWVIALGIEVFMGARLNVRYLMPVLSLMSLGAGVVLFHLIGVRLPRLGRVVTAVLVLAVPIAWALFPQEDILSKSASRNERLVQSLPSIKPAFGCGRPAINIPGHPGLGAIQARAGRMVLSAALRIPADDISLVHTEDPDFEDRADLYGTVLFYPSLKEEQLEPRQYANVLRRYNKTPLVADGWTRRFTTYGLLQTAPGCEMPP